MQFTVGNLNKFLFFKLPSAFWCGVRAKSIDAYQCTATVKFRWFNQNPFNSMYFAVQAMAAELTTGALVMFQIRKSGRKISMLVANNKANFTKKAVGRITFVCRDGHLIEELREFEHMSPEYSRGREFDNVFIYYHDILTKKGINALYIGSTRANKKLIVIK